MHDRQRRIRRPPADDGRICWPTVDVMAVSTRPVEDRLFPDDEKAAQGTIVYIGRDDRGWTLNLALQDPP